MELHQVLMSYFPQNIYSNTILYNQSISQIMLSVMLVCLELTKVILFLFCVRKYLHISSEYLKPYFLSPSWNNGSILLIPNTFGEWCDFLDLSPTSVARADVAHLKPHGNNICTSASICECEIWSFHCTK